MYRFRHVIWRILKIRSSGSKFYLKIGILLLSIIIFPSLKKRKISHSQKHVLKTRMAFNPKLYPNLAGEGLQCTPAEFKLTSVNLFRLQQNLNNI